MAPERSGAEAAQAERTWHRKSSGDSRAADHRGNTGSAFLLLAVTAPTDVCLKRPAIHAQISSPLQPPPSAVCLQPVARGQTGTPSPRGTLAHLTGHTHAVSLLGSDRNGCDPLY